MSRGALLFSPSLQLRPQLCRRLLRFVCLFVSSESEQAALFPPASLLPCQELLVGELQVGRAIRHHNLVQYYGMWQDGVGRHCLVMEPLAGGDLHTALSSGDELSWELRVGWQVPP